MKTHQNRILESLFVNNETCLRLDGSLLNTPLPGQFFQVFSEDSSELLPRVLYPCEISEEHFLVCGNTPRFWEPGDILHLRGPRGNGFHLPPLAKKVALTAIGQIGINRLLPLSALALSNKMEVTILTDAPISHLPPEIEVLPINELGQIKNWVDYLAAAVSLKDLSTFIQLFDLFSRKASSLKAEILLDTPMICDESSACGICGVNTTRGWKLNCKDGPVFSLDDLLGEDPSHG